LNKHHGIGTPVLSQTLPAFVDPRIGDVYAHWLASRNGRLVARREDIAPGAIVSCLPHVWIYRWRPERRTFQNVIAGEEINYAWGFSIRDKFIEELFGPDTPILCRRWLDLLERPAVAYGRLTGELAHGRFKRAERLNLPLVGHDGGPYGILGITIYDFDRLHANETQIPPPLDVVVVPCAALPGAPSL